MLLKPPTTLFKITHSKTWNKKATILKIVWKCHKCEEHRKNMIWEQVLFIISRTWKRIAIPSTFIQAMGMIKLVSKKEMEKVLVTLVRLGTELQKKVTVMSYLMSTKQTTNKDITRAIRGACTPQIAGMKTPQTNWEWPMVRKVWNLMNWANIQILWIELTSSI